MGIYIHGQVREIKKEVNRRPLTHSSNSSYKIALSFSLTYVLYYLHRIYAHIIFMYSLLQIKYYTYIYIYNISPSLTFLSFIIFPHLLRLFFFVNFLLSIQTGNIKLRYLSPQYPLTS